MTELLTSQHCVGHVDDIAVRDRRYQSIGEDISPVDKDIDAFQQLAFTRKEPVPQRRVKPYQFP